MAILSQWEKNEKIGENNICLMKGTLIFTRPAAVYKDTRNIGAISIYKTPTSAKIFHATMSRHKFTK